MSGVAVIRYLLANDPDLITAVTAARIKAGVLPLSTVLPGISIRKISSVQRKTLSMANTQYYWTERVQVTVMAKAYPALNTLMQQVRQACPVSKNDYINTGPADWWEYFNALFINVQSILIESESPDFYDPDSVIYSQSVDFMVSYIR